MENGEKTPQYRAIKSNYTGLGSSLEPVLRRVTAKCFEKYLIGTPERDRANSKREPEVDRAGDLVDIILKKIKSNIKWYEVFMKILEEFTELESRVQAITTSFTTTSGSLILWIWRYHYIFHYCFWKLLWIWYVLRQLL